MKTAKSFLITMFVLLTAQIASAYYCPSTGRWLSRDPIGEPGFQVSQMAGVVPSRWINRDTIGETGWGNLYAFNTDDPIGKVDKLGLCSCGPDITKTLTRTLLNIQRVFNNASPDDQKMACDHLNTQGGWDVGDLLSAKNLPGTCGQTGSCNRTVTINGACYFAPEVNYILYGKMCKLCNISSPWMHINIIGYKVPYKIWRDGKYDWQLLGAISWADAGYQGWPNTSYALYSDKKTCGPCKYEYPDSIFRWKATRIGSFMNE